MKTPREEIPPCSCWVLRGNALIRRVPADPKVGCLRHPNATYGSCNPSPMPPSGKHIIDAYYSGNRDSPGNRDKRGLHRATAYPSDRLVFGPDVPSFTLTRAEWLRGERDIYY